jgi:hypothetical protein
MDVILIALASMTALSVSVMVYCGIKHKNNLAQPRRKKKAALAAARRKFAAASAAEAALIQRLRLLCYGEYEEECAFFASQEHSLDAKKQYAYQINNYISNLRTALGVPSESLAMVERTRSDRLGAEQEKDISRKLRSEGVFQPLKKIESATEATP